MEDLPEFAKIIESLNGEYDKLYEEKNQERISFMKIIADLENKNNSMINTISQQIVDEVTHYLLEDYEDNMDGIDLIKLIEKYDYDKSNRSEIIRITLEKIKEFNIDVCISNIYYKHPYNPDEYEPSITLYMFTLTNDDDIRYIRDRFDSICPISEETISTCCSTDCMCLNIRTSI
jgi:hypothetical protein